MPLSLDKKGGEAEDLKNFGKLFIPLLFIPFREGRGNFLFAVSSFGSWEKG
jgi:hypothetical protein